jgi:hypothetical protein
VHNAECRFTNSGWLSARLRNIIRAIAAHLEALLSALSQISEDGQQYGKDENGTEILSRCKIRLFIVLVPLQSGYRTRPGVAHVQALIRMTEILETSFESSSRLLRKWGAIHVMFKEDKLNTFRTELAGPKPTLTLAQLRLLR